MACKYEGEPGDAAGKLQRVLTVCLAAVVVLVAVAMFSAWHKHDPKTGICTFNHLDGLHAEAHEQLAVDAPLLRVQQAEMTVSDGEPDWTERSHASPRAPPVEPLS